MLSEVPEERPGCDTQFERVELSALLREYSAEQAAESGRLLREADSK